MKTQDFGERVARVFTETVGNKKLYVAGFTAVRQTVVIGNHVEGEDGPFLFAVHARITDETGENERLQVAMFRTDPEAGEVRWLTVGDRTRIVLRSAAAAASLILPAGDSAIRYMVDGALLTPAKDMIPGVQPPPQQLPPSLEALRAELAEATPQPTLRLVA